MILDSSCSAELFIKEFNNHFSSPHQCKVKWRNYRDSYLKHIKTKEQMENSGMGDEFRGYKYAYALEFLDGSVKKWKFAAKRPAGGKKGDDESSSKKMR